METQTLAYNTPYAEEIDVHGYDISPEDVHIDAPVGNILLSYRPKNFIADEVLPMVPVGKQSDLVPGIKIEDQLRTEQDIRAPGTEPNLIHFNVTSIQYFCKNYALGTFLTAEEIANADMAWNTKTIRSQLIWDILMLNYELRVANTVNSTSNVGSSWDTASSWTDWDNGDPMKDVAQDLDIAEDLRGYRPNKIVFGKLAWRNWRNSDVVLSRLFPHGGGQGALITREMTASLLEVDKVLVGGAYYNSAAEDATLSLTKIWDDNVLYYWNPDRPSKEVPAYGYSFRWNVPGMPNNIVRTFPFDQKKGRTDMHIGYYQDEKITDKYLACLRLGVGSSQ